MDLLLISDVTGASAGDLAELVDSSHEQENR